MLKVATAEYVVPKMPVVKGYYNDSIVIDNWTNEMDAIVAALEELDACSKELFKRTDTRRNLLMR